MLSSGQVAQLVAQQNSMFVGTAQYAQQISASMPGAYGGLGQFGVGAPVQSYPQVPYAPRSQAGFNYGAATPLGYGLGNQAAAVGMSAMGAGANAGIAGLGIAGGLGLMGKAGMAFDPFSAGSAAFGVARGAGMGIGASLGVGAMGAALPMAGMAFAKHAVGSMVEGGQEQAGLDRVMGQFQHINSSSRTGKGFTRQDSMAMGDMMRHLQSMPEMLTSFSEMSRVLDKVGQMGMMQGARDIGEFQRKFKDIVGTLKNVSKVMGTSMEEAASFMGESRRSGIYSQADITKNAFARQLTGGVTGMNQQQVGALQQYGSQVSFATGGTRASGARHALRTANQLGMMNQMGHLSNDQIMELTGEEGAAGIQSLAGTMTEAAHRMSQSSLGTAMTLALGEQKGGRYTGKMDQELAERFRRGEIGKEELMKMARSKAGSRGAKLSYAAQKNKLRSEMASSVGVEGISMELQTILGERGWDNPDAQNLVMQRFGLDERQASTVQQLMKSMPNIQRGMMASGESDKRRIMEQAHYRENLSLDAIKKKIGKRIENVMTEPFKQMGAEIRNTMQNAVDEFVDDLTGRYSAELTKGTSSLIVRGGMGSKAAQEALNRAGANIRRSGIGGGGSGVVSTGGVMGMVRSLTGDTSIADSSASFLRGYKGGSFATEGGVDTGKAKAAAADLEKSGGMLGAEQAKQLESNPAYSRFRRELQQTLEVHGRDLEKLDPMTRSKALGEKLRETSRKNAGWFEDSAYDQMFSKGMGGLKDPTSAIMHTIARENLGGQAGALRVGEMAGSLRGLGGGNMSLAQVAKARGTLEKKLGRELGEDSGDIIKAVKEGGQLGALLTGEGGLFQGGSEKRNLLKSLIGQTGSVSQGQLDSLLGQGKMTVEQFEKMRPTLDKAMRAASSGKGADLNRLSQLSIVEGSLLNESRLKEAGGALRGRLDAAGGSITSEKGTKLFESLRGMAGSLEKGEGPAQGSIGDIAEQLAGAKGEEGKVLRRVAGGQLGAATSMYTEASKFLGKRGKVSIEDLGKKFGIDFNENPELRSQIEQQLGKGDKSGKNAVAKLLADLTGRGALSAAGGKQGSADSDLQVSENLKKLGENMKTMAEILGGVKSDMAKSGDKPPGGN